MKKNSIQCKCFSVPLVKAVGGHFMNLKRSACDNLLVDSASANG